MDKTYFPYQSEPIRSALMLSLVLAIVSAMLWILIPLLFLRLFVASFALGPLLWIGLQVQRRRHGISLEDEQIIIQHPITGLRRTVNYKHIQGIELIDNKLVMAYALPVTADPTYQPQSLSAVRPQTEQRKLVIIQGITQLDELADALRTRAVAKGATLKLDGDVLQVWANRIKIRKAIFVILGILASPVGCIYIFRTISGMIGR
jgi:hypothetical protein